MIKLIVDSTCELSKEEAEKLGVILIPMRIRFEDKEYLSGVNLDTDEFYKMLKEAKNLPTTSQVNENEYIDIIKPLLDAGDDVFVMSLSSELSGTFNSLRLASEEINSKHLEIFDTETVTFAYQALVYEAVKIINEGATLRSLKTKMNLLKTKVKLLAIVDNVKYLVKGGRLSSAAGLLVSAFKIKPIVSIIEGKVKMIAKAIGYNNAKKTMCKYVENVDTAKDIYYGHSCAPDKAEDLKSTLVEKFGYKFKQRCSLGPVIGTHSGPGCVGIVYFEK